MLIKEGVGGSVKTTKYTKELRRKICNQKGFTLVELVIVVAILATLTAVLSPSFGKYVFKSKTVACNSSREALKTAYQTNTTQEEYASEREALEGVLLENGKKISKQGTFDIVKEVCPDKGIYMLFFTSHSNLTVLCSKHQKDGDGLIAKAVQLLSNIEDAGGIQEWKKQNESFWGCLNNSTNGFLSNDDYRRILFQQNGGTWDSLSEEVVRNAGLTGNYYVQPYVVPQKGEDGTKTLIYATDKNTDGAAWGAKLIYDYSEGAWYRCLNGSYGISGLNSTLAYDQVMRDIKDTTKFEKVL